MNRCPLLDEKEWVEGHRDQVGPGAESYLEPEDYCPAWYGRSGTGAEIGQAMRWKDSLSTIYPLGVPEIVIAGVEYADSVLAAVQAEGRRLDEIEAEQRRRRNG